MKIQTSTPVDTPSHVILSVSGDVDIASKPELVSAGNRALERGATLLEFEMAEVRFIDSTGIGGLLALRRIATGRGSQVQVVNPSPPVLRVFQLAGLTGVLMADPDSNANLPSVSGILGR